MYQVIDRKTRKIMGTYKTLQGATRAVNRLELEYGDCRYFYQKCTSFLEKGAT